LGIGRRCRSSPDHEGRAAKTTAIERCMAHSVYHRLVFDSNSGSDNFSDPWRTFIKLVAGCRRGVVPAGISCRASALASYHPISARIIGRPPEALGVAGNNHRGFVHWIPYLLSARFLCFANDRL